ncbi:phosphopantothenoylcysteine decarboxylase, partial [Pseudomonas sp. HY2-MNA-CIBAN-0224]
YISEDEHDHSHEHSHEDHHAHHHGDCDCSDEHDVDAMVTNDSVRVADVFISTAAVADYRTEEAAPQKIKKTQDAMTLSLV